MRSRCIIITPSLPIIKTRIYPIYGRGYDLGNTTNELDKLVNNHKVTYTQADKEMEIPANTIKITFTEG